ncbi:hypothetical protein [Clostridium sp. DL1XJH146]
MSVQVTDERILELYEKYRTLNRTALSAGCSKYYVKKILIKHGVELKKYKPRNININSRFN